MPCVNLKERLLDECSGATTRLGQSTPHGGMKLNNLNSILVTRTPPSYCWNWGMLGFLKLPKSQNSAPRFLSMRGNGRVVPFLGAKYLANSTPETFPSRLERICPRLISPSTN
jgi:hypothetical protein